MDLSVGVVLLAAIAAVVALVGLALLLRGPGDEPHDPRLDEDTDPNSPPR